MPCAYIEKIKDYLEEKLPKKEMEAMEKHLESCKECQAKLDNYLDNKLNLETETPDVEDKVLVSKIKARIKGMRRITLYGLLGFTLGLFSRFYTLDNFFLTKAVMALPYKLAEFVLSIFFSGNVPLFWEGGGYHYQGKMGLFPYHPMLDILATTVTPSIIASFIAVIIGYLLSDKRVFPRKHIIKFAATWLIILLVWIGILYGTYNHALGKINNLEGINAMTVYTIEENNTSWLITIDNDALMNEKYARLITIISEAEKVGKKIYPQGKNGYEMLVNFSGGGTIPIFVDNDSGEMVVRDGNAYQIPPEKLEYINRVLGGIQND
ncbi:hypothetical protein Dtox_1360 [Desulfofarcimen acetoxidans DSM 771]|uniref:Putative zinc-finger domain-containing protein n=1 Tax=Desulfofarcimen acetoxidans (strain ATCC 49208 / DSM 771 / KCTC 5769 / VKM B-1644 / 5575) TaxID=485916 RepID=C8W6E7_DESAS|nr:zf-HC2 domain-containing protein [Desulfofarcimen acetoxidans]ACV62236.1 hypothetical protein Dtox_1360 [Desulfofarcimen acetoxidans DSM 771]